MLLAVSQPWQINLDWWVSLSTQKGGSAPPLRCRLWAGGGPASPGFPLQATPWPQLDHYNTMSCYKIGWRTVPQLHSVLPWGTACGLL